MPERRLTLLVHGDAGAGKSWLGNSAPGPRLLLDAEGRAEYLTDLTVDPTGMTPQRQITWDPRYEVPAESADPAVLTVVDVQDFDTVVKVYQWLQSGKHPFNSLVLDSLPELQQRLIDNVAGQRQLQIQDWGTVLRELEGYIRKFRDLRKNPTRPLWAVVVVAGSKEKNTKQRPMLQGQLADKVAFHFDVVGYLTKVLDEGGHKRRKLIIDGFVDNVEAKDNTHVLSASYGDVIWDPNVSAMLAVLNPPAPPELPNA